MTSFRLFVFDTKNLDFSDCIERVVAPAAQYEEQNETPYSQQIETLNGGFADLCRAVQKGS